MAQDKKNKLAQEYHDLCELEVDVNAEGTDNSSEVTGDTEAEGIVHTLRSGSQYPRVSPTDTNSSLSPLPCSSQSPMTNQNPTPPGATAPQGTLQNVNQGQNPPPFKLLQTNVTVQPFTGTESDNYTARDFIEQCEQVMQNSCTVQDADKIAFVRSCLGTGSRAGHAMRATAFDDPIRDQDYEAFRTNFLTVFEGENKRTLVKGVRNSVRTLLPGIADMDPLGSQILVSRVRKDCIGYLVEYGWFSGNTITKEYLGRFIEFFLYMLTVKGEYRESTASLDYKPHESLLEFVQKNLEKLEDKGKRAYTVGAAQAEQIVLGEPSYAAVAATSKSSVTCQYCMKEGHVTQRCFLKKKEDRQRRKAEVESRESSGQGNKSQPQEGPPRNQRKPSKANATADNHDSDASRRTGSNAPYCELHRRTGHATVDCYSFLSLRKRMHGLGGSSSTRSGEAARGTKQKPG